MNNKQRWCFFFFCPAIWIGSGYFWLFNWILLTLIPIRQKQINVVKIWFPCVDNLNCTQIHLPLYIETLSSLHNVVKYEQQCFHTYIIDVNILIHIHHKFSLWMDLDTSSTVDCQCHPGATTVYHWKGLCYISALYTPWLALSFCPWPSPPLQHRNPAPVATAAPHEGDALGTKQIDLNNDCQFIMCMFLSAIKLP